MTLSRMVRGLRWSGAASGGLALLGLLQLALLVRLLEKADFAEFALAAVFFHLGAQLQEGGLNAALIREQELGKVQLATLFWLNLLLSILLLGLSWPLAQFLSNIYALPGLAGTYWLLALLFPLNALRLQYKTLLQKDLRFRSLSWIEINAALAGMILAVVLAYAGWGVLSLVAGQALRIAGETLGAVAVGWSYFQPRSLFSWPSVRPHLRLAGDHWTERLLTHVVYQLDILLIGKVMGPDSLGIYEVFKRLLTRPSNLIASAVERVSFPIMARLTPRPSSLDRFYHRIVQVMLSAQLLVYIPVLILAPWVVTTYFGDDWSSYTLVFQWLIGLTLLLSVTQLTDSYLLVQGKIRRWSIAGICLALLWVSAILIGRAGALLGVVKGLVAAQVLFTLLLVPLVILPSHTSRSAYYQWTYPLLIAIGTAVATAYFLPAIPALILFLAIYLGWQYRYNRQMFDFLRQLLLPKTKAL